MPKTLNLSNRVETGIGIKVKADLGMARIYGEKDQDEPKRGRRLAPRADRVREVMLAVALESFSAQGFSGTSTRSIANLAGTRHSLVNYHFETKDKLWTAMMENVLGEYTRRVQAEFGKSEGASHAQKLRLYIDVYSKTAATRPEIFRILTQQSTQNSDRLDWLIDHYLEDHFNRICELIVGAQKEGAVIQGRPEHIFYLIAGAIGIFFAIPREYLILTGKDPFSAAEMHQIIDFVTGLIFIKKR